MSIIQNYFLNEENRLTKEARKGNLSKKTIKTAHKKGFFRPKKVMDKGLETGTKEIYKKTGTIIKDPPKNFMDKIRLMKDYGGAKIGPRYDNYKSKKQHPEVQFVNKKVNSLDKRHEAHEAQSINKSIIKDRPRRRFTTAGGHSSHKVLAKERKIVDARKNIYNDRVAKSLSNLRNKTGEYKKIEGKNNRQLRKMDNE